MTTALDAFGPQYLAFEGKVDVNYLIDIPNESSARAALTFLDNHVNEIELHKRNGPAAVQRAWKGVLRGCIAHGVELTADQKLHARALGIVLP